MEGWVVKEVAKRKKKSEKWKEKWEKDDVRDVNEMENEVRWWNRGSEVCRSDGMGKKVIKGLKEPGGKRERTTRKCYVVSYLFIEEENKL